jgi:hypothetical protein
MIHRGDSEFEGKADTISLSGERVAREGCWPKFICKLAQFRWVDRLCKRKARMSSGQDQG